MMLSNSESHSQTTLSNDQIAACIVNVSDFPKPGIVFKDITPILENPQAFHSLIKKMAEKIPKATQKLVAIESRGFIVGSALAQHLDVALILARKPGKLPRKTISQSFELEYGSDTLEIHEESIQKGDKLVIIDDVIATGGTAQAVEKLCLSMGAEVLAAHFILSIPQLNGEAKLTCPCATTLS